MRQPGVDASSPPNTEVGTSCRNFLMSYSATCQASIQDEDGNALHDRAPHICDTHSENTSWHSLKAFLLLCLL